jgi:hypothetical protein
MNQRSDLDRVLRNWFDDGPTTMPDRVVDVVAHRISVRPQRRSWRLPRRSPMSPILRWGAAAAAVLVIAVVGYNLLPGNGIGGPTTTPTTTPTTGLTATSAAVRPLPEGNLTAGRYAVQPFGIPDEGLTIEMTVPDGWDGIGDWALASPDGLAGPKGLGLAFLRPAGLFSDPCRWDALGNGTWPQAPDVAGGDTVDSLVAALQAQTAYEVSAPVDVTIGGFAGKRVDLDLPDTDVTRCDAPRDFSTGTYMVFGASDATGSNLYAQGPDQNWHLWILDLKPSRIVIVVNDYPGTNVLTHGAAEEIVESMTFRR